MRALGRAVIADRFGPARDVLRTRIVLSQAPRPHEVVIRLVASPINPSDLVAVRGAYAHRTMLPFIPGFEALGDIVSVGPGVASLACGDRVCLVGASGTWRHTIVVCACRCLRVPRSLPASDASQLYINPVTAKIICDEVLRCSSSDIVVLNAAGSAFAHVFVQLAIRRGARIVAVTRRPAAVERLRSLGAQVVVATDPAEIGTRVPPGRATAALDAVGGWWGQVLAGCVERGGRFVQYGLLGGTPIDVNSGAMRDLRVHSFFLRQWIGTHSIGELRTLVAHLRDKVLRQELTLLTARASYSLDRVTDAILAAERTDADGKGLLVP